jgi:predicted alpha/beta-hydrolase family hydrolase
VQGSRDAFGSPAELQPIVAQLAPVAEMFVVEGADHSFKIPKSAGIDQQAVHRAVQHHIENWLRRIVSGGR